MIKIKLSFLSLMCSMISVGTTEVFTTENGVSPFEEPFIYFFMFLGIVVTLGRDIRDPKKKEKLTWDYILWSLFISIGFSILVAIAWESGILTEFYTYLIVVAVSAFAPLIIDRYVDKWVDRTGEAVSSVPGKFVDKVLGKDEQDFTGNIEDKKDEYDDI